MRLDTQTHGTIQRRGICQSARPTCKRMRRPQGQLLTRHKSNRQMAHRPPNRSATKNRPDGALMDYDQWWNSQAADAFRAAHPDADGEQFRCIWDAATSHAASEQNAGCALLVNRPSRQPATRPLALRSIPEQPVPRLCSSAATAPAHPPIVPR